MLVRTVFEHDQKPVTAAVLSCAAVAKVAKRSVYKTKKKRNSRADHDEIGEALKKRPYIKGFLRIHYLVTDKPIKTAVVARGAKTAVLRNKIKRRLRALITVLGHELPQSGIIIFIGTPAVYNTPFLTVVRDARELIKQTVN